MQDEHTISSNPTYPSRIWVDRSARPSTVQRICHSLGDCLQLLIVGVLLDYLLFSGTDLSVAPRLFVIALLLMSVARSNGWALLVAIQISLFLAEPSRSEMSYGTGSFLFCYVSMGLVAYAFCAQTTRGKIGRWLAAQVSTLVGEDWYEDDKVARTSSAWWRVTASVIGGAVALAGIVLVSMLALTYLPISAEARSGWLGRSLGTGSYLWPGATILVLLFGAMVVLREASWRRMTAGQARLYLRSTFLSDHHRDLRMIVLRRLKKRRRGVRE